MAQYKDVLPSQMGWIHELAKAEVHPEAERLLQLGRSFDPQQLVEESTIDFLTELRQNLAEYARIFNGYSEAGARFPDIKIYSVAQTPADFMMFRNQVKLVVSNTVHGVIQVAFARHVRGNVAVDGQVQSVNGGSLPNQSFIAQPQELLAQVGPFRDVFWTFHGEKVEAAQVAKFYFAEFVRTTRESKRSKVGDQVLLEQIKSLLQEKGFDL